MCERRISPERNLKPAESMSTKSKLFQDYGEYCANAVAPGSFAVCSGPMVLYGRQEANHRQNSAESRCYACANHVPQRVKSETQQPVGMCMTVYCDRVRRWTATHKNYVIDGDSPVYIKGEQVRI